MQCLIKRTGCEGYEYIKTDIPKIHSDEVLIKVAKVGVCGSDIALYKWNHVAQVIAKTPFIPGHEASGLVIEVGSNVTRLNVGDRIAVENHFYCGECYQCKHDMPHICQNLNQYGHGKGTDQGGFSQYSTVKEKYCYKLTTDITYDEAALIEPMGVAHNAMESLKVSGEGVLVIGCGAVGSLAIACAKTMGAASVIAVDVSSERLKLAKALGADVCVNPTEVDLKKEVMSLTNNDGIGRICEASGNAAALNSCFKYLRKGGRLCMIGLPKAPMHIDDVLQDIVFKCVTITTVHGRKIFRTWEECEKLIHQKKVDVSKVVSHQLKMSQHKTVFEILLSGKGCKILVDPQG